MCPDLKCLPRPFPIEYLVVWPVLLVRMPNFMDIRVNDFELEVYLIFFQLYLTLDVGKNDNHQPFCANI